MNKTLTAAQRLIVTADFKPRPDMGQGRADVRSQVLSLATRLKGTGVCFKVNSALRACGYDMIDEIHQRYLGAFADLKLYDIGETLSTDGVLLREAKPELLTVACSAGKKAISKLKAELPDTEILGITVLTTFDDEDATEVHGASVSISACRLAYVASAARADGLICAATEVAGMVEMFERRFSLNAPAIRPSWANVPGDDQNPERIMTPAKAIKAGADRIVVGRPINKAADPYDAVMRTIDEIAAAMEEVNS